MNAPANVFRRAFSPLRAEPGSLGAALAAGLLLQMGAALTRGAFAQAFFAPLVSLFFVLLSFAAAEELSPAGGNAPSRPFFLEGLAAGFFYTFLLFGTGDPAGAAAVPVLGKLQGLAAWLESVFADLLGLFHRLVFGGGVSYRYREVARGLALSLLAAFLTLPFLIKNSPKLRLSKAEGKALLLAGAPLLALLFVRNIPGLLAVPVSVAFYFVTAALPEELVFRRAFQSSLRSFSLLKEKPGARTAIAAALFALAHVPLYWGEDGAAGILRIGAPLCAGLSMGALWERSRNLWLAVLYHALFDAAVL
ncbi:MAG: CPBP family intramembrane glutamic endopeptidase [Bdellovibrionota bacterium]